MTNYTGFLNMLVWVEAENLEEANKKIEKLNESKKYSFYIF
jgi:hypothetical protein